MRLLTILLLSSSFFLTSCGNDDLPDCIQEKLDAFEADASVCSSDETSSSFAVGGNLLSYNFKAQTVYCFNWGLCNPNKTIEIWTEDCVLLCEMGGPDQVAICDGVPWDGNSEEIESFYQK